ncbi:flavoprotein [Kibdelosporangium aridum]|uniref:Flavoprotein n=1 Tax=Kibdelosporangium aridum TaxID=2030 RepID=A0A1W2FZM2_KIBAR|nr:flavoprotein [Kibdelosporangium aridum]SMD27234.1 Flavoprotein [Kibdelosporangium aridum]
MSGPVVGLVGSAAGGVEEIASKLIEPVMQRGLRVAVTLTPTAWTWLDAMGEVDKIEQLTGLPVRHKPRMPWEDSPHPKVDCYAVVPATSNTVAKMALGIADNQALTQVCEAIGLGEVPVVVFPRVNAAHVNHPAWDDHIAKLTRAGVRLVMGEAIWPLHKPGSAPGKELPWAAILDLIFEAVHIGQ